jgi:hypothetical protein
LAIIQAMPTLTCRREKGAQQQSWNIFFGDVRVGWIGERAGVPKDVEQWGWSCGFPPVSHRGIRAAGLASTFDQARREFEAAWRDYLPQCTEADFDASRYESAFTAWKYAMWGAGCKLPTQTADDRSQCFCGVVISNRTTGDHIRTCHMGQSKAPATSGSPLMPV